MNKQQKAVLHIHIAVLLFGVAGLFGKLLPLSAPTIVLGRTFLAGLTLLGILLYKKLSLKPDSTRVILIFVFLGGLLAFHWVAFFRAIQLSTVAIGLLTYSSFPAFVTLMEPWFLRTRYQIQDITAVAVVALGLVLVVPEYDFSQASMQGAVWGVLSGLSFALLQIMNRKYVERYSSLLLAFYQNSFACFVLLPFGSLAFGILDFQKIVFIIFLGVFCTALAHTLFIEGMKRVTAQFASIISTLEPVYGIVLAAVLLDEIPTVKTLLGGVMILTTVVFITYRNRGQDNMNGRQT